MSMPADNPAGRGSRAVRFDITVIASTMLRPSLADALRSLYAQDFQGRIEILLGVARPTSNRALLDRLCSECPSNMVVEIYAPGYAAGRRPPPSLIAREGGSLRAALSSLARARYLAYLDEQTLWAPDHLSSLRAAIRGTGFAYAQCTMVRTGDDAAAANADPSPRASVAESAVPNRGAMIAAGALMIDRWRAPDLSWRWARTDLRNGSGTHAEVIHTLLRKQIAGTTGRATVLDRHGDGAPMIRADTAIVAQAAPAQRVTLAGLREALAPKISTGRRGPGSRPQTDPVAADDMWRKLLRDSRPSAIVDLWADEAGHILRLLAAARAEGLTPSILAVDTWLPQPGENPDRGVFAMHRHGVRHTRFLQSLASADPDGLAWTLPGCPLQAGRTLYQLGLRIELLTFPILRPQIDRLLAVWWPLLTDGGAAACDLRHGFHRDASDSLRLFMRPNGIEPQVVGEGEHRLLVLRKSAARQGHHGAAA